MLETMSTGGAIAAAVPPGPELEGGADMTVAEAKDAVHAPDVVSVVRSMPTRLVEPVDGGDGGDAGGGAAAAQGTWGASTPLARIRHPEPEPGGSRSRCWTPGLMRTIPRLPASR